MRGLWPIALRAIWNRRWRSALTAAAVALGIAIILGVQTTLGALSVQAEQAQADRAGGSELDLRTSSDAGFQSDQIATLDHITGVAIAVPVYEKRVIARTSLADTTGVTVTMVSVDSDGTSALRPINLQRGRLPEAGSHNEVAIDAGLASVLGDPSHGAVGIGSTIYLTTVTGPDAYRVVGLTAGTSAGAAFTHSAVFASESEMTSAFALGVHIPLVALRLEPGATTKDVSCAIRVAFDHAQAGCPIQAAVTSGIIIVDPRNGGASPLTQLQPLLVLLTVLSLFVGAGVTANSVSLSALERRRETALLRAAGASAQQVTRIFLIETAVVAVLAAPFGLIAGIALGSVMTNAVTSGAIVAHTTSGVALVSMGIGVGCGILGAAVPAVLAGRHDILEGLRPHPSLPRDHTSRQLLMIVPIALTLAVISFLSGDSIAVSIGAALLVVALVAALPALTPLLVTIAGFVVRIFSRESSVAVANLRRHRNRTALTIAGLTVAVATAIASATLAAGAADASDVWIRNLFVGDAVIKSPVTQSDAIAGSIAGSTGVRHVSELRLMSAPVAGDVTGIAVIDAAAYTDSGGLDVVRPARGTALQALGNGAAVLVPQILADTNGWDVGSNLLVDNGRGGTAVVRVAGVVSHSFPAGDGRESLIMARPAAHAVFGVIADGFDDLMVTTDGNLGAVRNTAASYGLSAVSVGDIQNSARAALQHSVGLLQAIAITALVIAMLAVINTLVVNIRQGTRELALLRAVGLSRRRARGLVLAEAALMSLAGTLLGLGAGAILALPMISASSTNGFAPPFVYAGTFAGAIAAAVVLATLLAAAAPARRAVSASIVSAIRYE